MKRPKTTPSRGRKPADKEVRRPESTPGLGKGKVRGGGGLRPDSVDRRPTEAPGWKSKGKRREA